MDGSSGAQQPPAAPPERRGAARLPWRPQGRRDWLVAGGAAVVVLGLLAALLVLLLRPAPAAKPASPPVAQQPAPNPSPSPAGTPDQQVQQRQFRAYTVTVLTNATSLAASTASLKDCGDRSSCEHRLSQAEAQVNRFQQALNENPAPACLSSSDDHLRNGLTFQQRGFQLAQEAIGAKDRVKLVQSGTLVGAGLYQERLAVYAARTSSC